MSRNYRIELQEAKTEVETAGDRLASISQLLPPYEKLADKDLGRNILTRTLDMGFALVRRYLPPVHWILAAMTATVMFLYVQMVAVTARLVTTGSRGWPHVPTPSVAAIRPTPSLTTRRPARLLREPGAARLATSAGETRRSRCVSPARRTYLPMLLPAAASMYARTSSSSRKPC
jgi:hypothetical protein